MQCRDGAWAMPCHAVLSWEPDGSNSGHVSGIPTRHDCEPCLSTATALSVKACYGITAKPTYDPPVCTVTISDVMMFDLWCTAGEHGNHESSSLYSWHAAGTSQRISHAVVLSCCAGPWGRRAGAAC